MVSPTPDLLTWKKFFPRLLTGSAMRTPLLIASMATLLALAGSLLVYPEVAGPLQNKLTTDRYDELALGIVQNGTLSFFPDPEPTILRGPVYPYFLAAIFSLGEGLLPYSVQMAQALLHGLTCFLVFQIGAMLLPRRRAILAALLCAVHPYLLWYTGRMVIETVSVTIFTLIVFCVLRLVSRPGAMRALLAGLAVGAGVLCKSTYLPFMAAIPLLLLVPRKRSVTLFHALVVFVAALAVIAPWIVRNQSVSGQWGIVQALTGYNFYVGDAFVERYADSPLGYRNIIERTDFTAMDEGLPDDIRQLTGARREARQDAWLLSRSVGRYMEDPGFLFCKLAANAVMFWTLGSTPVVSAVTMTLQLPLLFFFIRSSVRQMRRRGIFCAECIPIWLIVLYFGIHLPVYALARFSVVLIPAMLVYALFTSVPPAGERS